MLTDISNCSFLMLCSFEDNSLLMWVITAWNLACHDCSTLLYRNHILLPTWGPVDSFWDSKGPNLIPDHVIQFFLHLCRGLCALSQDHVRINALPLDVVVNSASSNLQSFSRCLAACIGFSHADGAGQSWHIQEDAVQNYADIDIICMVAEHQRQRPFQPCSINSHMHATMSVATACLRLALCVCCNSKGAVKLKGMPTGLTDLSAFPPCAALHSRPSAASAVWQPQGSIQAKLDVCTRLHWIQKQVDFSRSTCR